MDYTHWTTLMSRMTSLKYLALAATLAIVMSAAALIPTAEPEVRTSYIVQGKSFESVLAAIGELDAEVTHELGVISAIAVKLTETEAEDLRQHAGIKRL